MAKEQSTVLQELQQANVNVSGAVTEDQLIELSAVLMPNEEIMDAIAGRDTFGSGGSYQSLLVVTTLRFIAIYEKSGLFSSQIRSHSISWQDIAGIDFDVRHRLLHVRGYQGSPGVAVEFSEDPPSTEKFESFARDLQNRVVLLKAGMPAGLPLEDRGRGIPEQTQIVTRLRKAVDARRPGDEHGRRHYLEICTCLQQLGRRAGSQQESELGWEGSPEHDHGRLRDGLYKLVRLGELALLVKFLKQQGGIWWYVHASDALKQLGGPVAIEALQEVERSANNDGERQPPRDALRALTGC